MNALDPLIRNHVTVCGNPDALQTIVFSHGFGTDQTAWSALVEALGGRYRIVLFDHVGQGQSAPGAFEQHCYLNLDRYATDLVEVCDRLGLTGAIAVGHSMGAMICLLASLQKPGLFSRLVLLCASPRYRNDGDYYGGMSEEEFGRTYRAIHENYPEWASAYAPMAISDEHPAHFTKAFAAGLAAIPQENVLTIACSVLQSDYRAVLPKVQVPTLIIQPSADVAVPREVAEYLHAHIRGSQLRVIEARGHLPHITTPDEVLHPIEDFLAR
ncbi:MAG: alpha/beta hydrolase [Zoogloea sp.]|uniref:alpha/beta fold hydrolase n=1 Tax=Zoogloea sp. TaxID=49181 RepID=UPI0026336D8C|nr:alpha/beta hydrolase [Zoogloea sp.]MDD3326160.1 alpha/beta hydrolase [Zoogloea sp.]